MSELLTIHSETPQTRLIAKAAELIQQGAVVIYPTDSSYAIGCRINEKVAADRIRLIRRLSDEHHFTLNCRDLSELAVYAKVSNPVYRLLKAHTPGAYTFILPASNEVPRRLQHPKRKSIGLRIPDHRITQALLSALTEPLMSVTMQLPEQDYPLADLSELPDWLEKQVDVIIDGGQCGIFPTTVIDLTTDRPMIVREGKGDITNFK